jgi:hypothetical protein
MSIRSRRWSKEQLINAVQTSRSHSQVLRKLGLAALGGNYAQLKKYLKECNLDTSHFRKQGWSKGLKIKPYYHKTISELLVENSETNTVSVKRRLLKEGIFEYKCYKCSNISWNDQPIPLELEHINGIRTDNRLENLTLLCPNCHAQTSTYRGKNIKIRTSDGTEYMESLKGSGREVIGVRVSSGVPNRCHDCKRIISEIATRCNRCSQKDKETKIEWPSTNWLKEQINKGESYVSLGRKLGVTDNAIRKRIKNHAE